MSFEPTRPDQPQIGAPVQPQTPYDTGQPTPGFTPAPPEPAPVASSPKRRSGGRWLNVALGVALAVAIGGVAFAVGRSTAPASAATGFPGVIANGTGPRGSFAPGAGNGGPTFVGGGFGAGGGLTLNGTVESVDADSITIKTANGQTIEVATGADTTYHTQAPASASDVKEGSTVQVQLDFAGRGNGNGGNGGFRPNASGAPTGPIGTAGSVTVVP